MNTTDQFGADPQMYTQDSIQELKDAAEQVKQCGITPDENGGSGSYSQCSLKEYLKAVERFADNNFPALPTNSQSHPGEYLNVAMDMICSRVIGLVPVLEDSGLLSYLWDSYNRRLFDMLHLLMDRCSSVKDSFFLLQWVKNAYFRYVCY